MDYIFAGLNIFFSPITFLLFFIITPINHVVLSEDPDVNVVRLVPQTYFIFCAALLMMAVLVVAFYNILAPQKLFLIDILQPKYYWISVASWMITALTLKKYLRGIEGNIMGFVFFSNVVYFISGTCSYQPPLASIKFQYGRKAIAAKCLDCFFDSRLQPAFSVTFSCEEGEEKSF